MINHSRRHPLVLVLAFNWRRAVAHFHAGPRSAIYLSPVLQLAAAGVIFSFRCASVARLPFSAWLFFAFSLAEDMGVSYGHQ